MASTAADKDKFKVVVVIPEVPGFAGQSACLSRLSPGLWEGSLMNLTLR